MGGDVIGERGGSGMAMLRVGFLWWFGCESGRGNVVEKLAL